MKKATSCYVTNNLLDLEYYEKRNRITEFLVDNIINGYCAWKKSKIKNDTNYRLVIAYFEGKYNSRHGRFKSFNFPKMGVLKSFGFSGQNKVSLSSNFFF